MHLGIGHEAVGAALGRIFVPATPWCRRIALTCMPSLPGWIPWSLPRNCWSATD